MKKSLIIAILASLIIIGGCDSKKEVGKNTSVEMSKKTKSKKVEKKNIELGDYKNLKIGETVPIKYHESAEGKVAFDFTLNKVEFTNKELGGVEPEYESGFIVLDVTIKNTGEEPLEVDLLTGMKYGTSMVSLGERYGFSDLSESSEMGIKESKTGKMVFQHSKSSNRISWGLEGFTTTFSYDINADEIGDYVPE
ncbi:hypothetical protein [Carnobacterium divergens]|uniref:hypothetical protein n=1 Tax=Carnobacterium divergens TaxID=2748 RepID=UPI001072C3D3|nr:hypothetical protein [Carnobacterium divergens]TFI73694.1 hypothetical protein CKN81_05415 [Carnobacterium divergens]